MKIVFDRKTAFGALILVLILAAITVGAWFFWGRESETEKEAVERAGTGKLPLAESGEMPPAASVGASNGKNRVSLPLFAAEEQGKTPGKDDFSAFFEQTAEKVFISVEELKKQFSPRIGEKCIPVSTPTMSGDLVFSMSDEEYFKRVYPAEYIKYLNDLQDAMLRDAFILESGKITFKTEEDTINLFLKFIDYAFSKGYIKSEEKTKLQEGVQITLRELNKQERPFVEKRLLQTTVLEGTLHKLIALFASDANAQSVTVGECYTMGAYRPGGFNAWSFCCNCGLWCGYGCSFVYDCGPAGVLCNSGWYGCLNGVCYYQPAIWDPMGGICGCG